MKFLLVIVAVLVGVWLWRSSRPAVPKRNQPPTRAAPTPEPLEMVRCAFCSVHLPSVDAVQGTQGLYCSVDHRHRAEP